jgi:hypothetical protein
MILAGEKPKNSKNLPSATLSTVNPTSADLGSNPGLRGERLTINGLNHGTARIRCIKTKRHYVIMEVSGVMKDLYS